VDCSWAGEAAKVGPPKGEEEGQMSTDYAVPSIVCDGCAELLTERIGQVPGVSGVQVDVAGKTVMVEGTAEDAAVRAAIAEAGHRVA
jgi:copper chaperone